MFFHNHLVIRLVLGLRWRTYSSIVENVGMAELSFLCFGGEMCREFKNDCFFQKKIAIFMFYNIFLDFVR